ncbi:MAG: PAS domain-containing protein, partial [Pseudomonadota bacterium]
MNQGFEVEEKIAAEANAQSPYAPAPLLDRAERVNSVTRLLIVGLVLLGIMGLFTILPNELARQATLVILGILAMVGVFFVLSLAIGWVHLSSRSRGDTFAKAFLDGLSHGAVAIDWNGRIVYANHAYGEMTGATKASELATVERVFAHSDEASEIVYRMNQRVRAGETVTEEFRMICDVRDRANSGEVLSPRWYRLTVRRQDHEDHHRPLLVWEMSDVTQERARQESVFQELQHAIDYLDHAPAGFFSASSDGGIVYLNA